MCYTEAGWKLFLGGNQAVCLQRGVKSLEGRQEDRARSITAWRLEEPSSRNGYIGRNRSWTACKTQFRAVLVEASISAVITCDYLESSRNQ